MLTRLADRSVPAGGENFLHRHCHNTSAFQPLSSALVNPVSVPGNKVALWSDHQITYNEVGNSFLIGF